MVNIQAIKYVANAGSLAGEAIDLSSEAPQALEPLKNGQQPVALVIAKKDLEAVRSIRDLVDSVGSKHPGKGLSDRLLTGTLNKSPLMEYDYKLPGQASRSIRTLLTNAAQKGVNQLFIIAVPAEIFAGLHARLAGAAPPRPSAKPLSGKADGASAEDEVQCSPLQVIPPIAGEDGLRGVYWGSSEQARLVRRLIVYASRAKRGDPVLIMGETGTGKDKVARLIHQTRFAGNAAQPFVTVNCGGIPETLLESELFGVVPGAFTDAKQERAGLWESAGDGTLFLDEIGDMPLSQQAKVLRALQHKSIRRLGENRERSVRARVVSATNRDLHALVQRGLFREDLYHRLSGFIIRTSPLREQVADIPVFIERYWREIAVFKAPEGGEAKRPPLADEVVNLLMDYGWPGNVRQLKHFISAIDNHFPPEVRPTALGVKVLAQTLGFSLDSWTVAERACAEARSEDLGLHRAQCLRHLKLVEEVLETVERLVGQMATARKGGPELARELKARLRRVSSELHPLCQPERRLSFHHEATFRAVEGLSQKIFAYACELDGNSPASLAAWAQGIAGEVESAISTVFAEVERILDKA